jgi:Asp-tRNA(Asn)/Glu-tRNA(Gln) amidotransferase A subunit family amidase
MPLNLQTLEGFRESGIDVLKDHREDLPPEYLYWVEHGLKMSALDFFRDQALRSEIYDIFQSVFERYHLLLTPTLACLPVDNQSRAQYKMLRSRWMRFLVITRVILIVWTRQLTLVRRRDDL